MSLRPAGLLAGILASIGLFACADDPRAPFDLDSIPEPTGDCVSVVHEALEIGTFVHAYLADAPGSSGGWALATVLNEFDQARIAVVRVPASELEPELAPIELGPSSLASTRVELRAGVAAGELWVLLDSGATAILRKLVPGTGIVAGNGSIANFPIPSDFGCPNEYRRQLLLIEGRPYVLALPDCSGSSALDLQLLELDPETLLFTSSWVLTFDPCANDPECAPFPYTLEQIHAGESSQLAGAERVSVGFSQVRQFDVGLTSTDISLLELLLVAGEPTARLVTFRQVWVVPTNVGPVHLAQDPFSVQLHVRNGNSETDAALLRLDGISESYVQVTTPQLLPFGGRGQLVQLDTQSAIVDVDAGALELIPLVDVMAWPAWQPSTLYELDDLVGFEPAGVGQLLLRREDAPPQIVQLRCVR